MNAVESLPAQGTRILIVDDETSIVRLLQAYLEREGYEVTTASDGRSALQMARAVHPHLVVLDLLLPEIDGLEVCRLLRQESDVSIIMLTARSEETDKVIGLSVGADDYVTKPFSGREMVARIKAVLRRTRRTGAEAEAEPPTLRFPNLTIDTGRHEVTVHGREVALTALDFEILRTLAAKPGLVFTRAQLLERVWGYDFMGDERVVDVHIGLLRKKIELDVADPSFVKTVRGVGYKFDDSGGIPMTGPRALAKRLWRQIIWRLFASYLVVSLVGIGMLVVFAAVLSSGYFSVQFTAADLPGLHRSLFQGLVAAMAVAIGTSVAVSLFVSHRIVDPLHQLMDASRRIASGHYEERVHVEDDFEITQLADSFNKMADALAQTEARRQALIADVAHELRTPLTSIKGYMEALLDGVMPADQETYSLIYSEADRLYRLVKDLQELSRLEARQIPLELHPVAVLELVHGVIGRVRPQFEAKGVRLVGTVAPDAGYVLGDADRLFQVLLNLLANALHYTPGEGRVQVAAYLERGQVCISVQDSGIGIAPEHLEQIFGRFYRVDKSRSRVAGGTGIGLTIARHLAEAHGGGIAVASTPELGSTFTVALPSYTAPPPVTSAPSTPALVAQKAS